MGGGEQLPYVVFSQGRETAVVGEGVYSDHLCGDKRFPRFFRGDGDSTILCWLVQAALGSSPLSMPSSKMQDQ